MMKIVNSFMLFSTKFNKSYKFARDYINKLPTKRITICENVFMGAGFAIFWKTREKRRCFEGKSEKFLRKGLTKRFVCGIIIKPLVQGFLKKHSALPFHSEFLKKRYEICTQ